MLYIMISLTSHLPTSPPSFFPQTSLSLIQVYSFYFVTHKGELVVANVYPKFLLSFTCPNAQISWNVVVSCSAWKMTTKPHGKVQRPYEFFLTRKLMSYSSVTYVMGATQLGNSREWS